MFSFRVMTKKRTSWLRKLKFTLYCLDEFSSKVEKITALQKVKIINKNSDYLRSICLCLMSLVMCSDIFH